MPVAPPEGHAYRLVAERVARETSGGYGPSVLADRVRAVHHAQLASDALALEDAIAGVASAAILWADRLMLARTTTPELEHAPPRQLVVA